MRWGAVAAVGLVAGGMACAQSLAPAGSKAVVLYFVATDCPVSNRTFPEMRRVREAFAGPHSAKGVEFKYVYPNTGEHAAEVKQHQAEFDAGGEAVVDAAGDLVALAHAHVTPEAVVLVPQGAGWRVVYAGKVDDRYLRLGVERPQATQHYVEQVLDEVLSGRPVQAAVGNPVGCSIVNPRAPAVQGSQVQGSQTGGRTQ